MTYFAGFELGTGSAVMVTGSHNPPEYNGLKMVIAGETLHGQAIQGLLATIRDGATSDARIPGLAARGRLHQEDVAARYLDRVTGDHPEAVRLARPMRIAIDAGNGIAGAFAPALFRALGCEVIELFCEVDGSFPNHHPDPAHPENLADLIRAVQSQDAELGLAFDGDGDRLGVVTRTGNIIWPDRQLILMARDVLSRRPGAEIIFDVKCSRHVAHEVRAAGGVPLMNATGHSLIKARLRSTGAPFAGELSGHLFFAERWYGFDDGLYAGARLLEILSRASNASEVLDAIPQDQSTPELQVKLPEGENHRFVAQLLQTHPLAGERERITIDGLRVEFEDGFGLVRASNTTPVLVCRFEGDSARALSNIQAQFAQAMRAIDPTIALSF
jgi:phosphomannomutase/phosphoglucomutase